MADELLTIADAVVEELNESGRWSFPFEAERKYVLETELDSFEPEEMHVTVLAGGRTWENEARDRTRVTYTVAVVFQQKLLPNTDETIVQTVEEQCDPLMEQVQEVAEWFNKAGSSPLATYQDARFLNIVFDVAYDTQALQENGLFASQLTLTFVAWRAKR
jgi:hypothetical protein